jgi:hypothetical protein
VKAVRSLAEANIKRRQVLESYAASKGVSLPGQNDANNVEEFKQKMMEQLQKQIPDSARGLTAGHIVDGVLRTSFQNARLDAKGGPEKMSIDLAVSLANEAGISKTELEEMLRSIEDPNDKGPSDFLRDNILPQIRERDSIASQGLPDAFKTSRPSVISSRASSSSSV